MVLCGNWFFVWGRNVAIGICLYSHYCRRKFIKQLYKKTSYNLVIHCPIDVAEHVIQYIESKSSNVLLNKFEIQYVTNECVLIVHSCN